MKLKKIILFTIILLISISLFATTISVTLISTISGSIELGLEAEDNPGEDTTDINLGDFSNLNKDEAVYSDVYDLIYSYNLPSDQAKQYYIVPTCDGLYSVTENAVGNAPIKVTFVDKNGVIINYWPTVGGPDSGKIDNAVYKSFRLKLEKNITGILPAGEYKGTISVTMVAS